MVLQVREPSMGMIQLGKISQVLPFKTWGYINNLSAQMRDAHESAVAPCVVELMKAWHVDYIYYYDMKEMITYRVSLKDLLEYGQLKHYSYRPAYWHLHARYWHEMHDRVQSIYTNETLMLDWEQPEIAPDPSQLAFSF